MRDFLEEPSNQAQEGTGRELPAWPHTQLCIISARLKQLCDDKGTCPGESEHGERFLWDPEQ